MCTLLGVNWIKMDLVPNNATKSQINNDVFYHLSCSFASLKSTIVYGYFIGRCGRVLFELYNCYVKWYIDCATSRRTCLIYVNTEIRLPGMSWKKCITCYKLQASDDYLLQLKCLLKNLLEVSVCLSAAISSKSRLNLRHKIQLNSSQLQGIVVISDNDLNTIVGIVSQLHPDLRIHRPSMALSKSKFKLEHTQVSIMHSCSNCLNCNNYFKLYNFGEWHGFMVITLYFKNHFYVCNTLHN